MTHTSTEQPENVRDGAPYDNPAFEALARDMGVWGTAQSALCAQFWLASQAQRVPLSGAQIEKLRQRTFSTDNPFCPCDSKTMQKAVQAAERAHGITQEKQG